MSNHKRDRFAAAALAAMLSFSPAVSVMAQSPEAQTEETQAPTVLVGDLSYPSVQAAIEASVKEEPVVIDVAGTIQENAVVPEGMNLTIRFAEDARWIAPFTDNSVPCIVNRGELTIEGGTFESDLNAPCIENLKTLTLNNTILETKGSAPAVLNGAEEGAKAEAVLVECTIHGTSDESTGIVNEKTGTLKFESGSIESAMNLKNEGTAVIEGGSFTTKDKSRTNIHNLSSGNLTINGGDFYGPKTGTILSGGGQAKVTGGTYYANQAGVSNAVVKGRKLKLSSKTGRYELVPAATSLMLSVSSAEIAVGESVVLNVTVLPEDAADRTVMLVSQQPEIASVKAEGTGWKVTGIKEGTAKIKATGPDGTSAEAEIKVNPKGETPSQSKLTVTPGSADVKMGETLTLKAEISPKPEKMPLVLWKSSDESIATVDKEGKVTPKKTGSTTITALTADGLKAESRITVKAADASAPEKTTLKLDAASKDVAVKGTVILKATVTPESKAKSVKWSSSDTKIATVDQTGKVTGVKKGTVTITAEVDGIKATCKVTVKTEAEMKKNNPNTSTQTNSGALIALGVGALVVLGGLFYFYKKRNK